MIIFKCLKRVWGQISKLNFESKDKFSNWNILKYHFESSAADCCQINSELKLISFMFSLLYFKLILKIIIRINIRIDLKISNMKSLQYKEKLSYLLRKEFEGLSFLF